MACRIETDKPLFTIDGMLDDQGKVIDVWSAIKCRNISLRGKQVLLTTYAGAELSMRAEQIYGHYELSEEVFVGDKKVTADSAEIIQTGRIKIKSFQINPRRN